MAISAFNKNLWTAQILTDFHNVSVLDSVATQPFEKNGQFFYYNRAKSVDVKDYAGNVAYDALDGEQIPFAFDKKKYFAIAIDDVDAVQVAPNGLMNTFTQEAGSQIAEQYDKDGFAQLVTECEPTHVIDVTSPSAEEIYNTIIELAVKLDKAKAPKTDRYVVMNSEIASMLSLDARFTRFEEVLSDGAVEAIGTIRGMKIIVSEEVEDDKIIVFHKTALIAGKQINKTEALRLEGSFSDAVRGLTVYGMKVVRPEAIAVANLA